MHDRPTIGQQTTKIASIRACNLHQVVDVALSNRKATSSIPQEGTITGQSAPYREAPEQPKQPAVRQIRYRCAAATINRHRVVAQYHRVLRAWSTPRGIEAAVRVRRTRTSRPVAMPVVVPDSARVGITVLVVASQVPITAGVPVVVPASALPVEGGLAPRSSYDQTRQKPIQAPQHHSSCSIPKSHSRLRRLPLAPASHDI